MQTIVRILLTLNISTELIARSLVKNAIKLPLHEGLILESDISCHVLRSALDVAGDVAQGRSNASKGLWRGAAASGGISSSGTFRGNPPSGGNGWPAAWGGGGGLLQLAGGGGGRLCNSGALPGGGGGIGYLPC